MHPYNLYLHNSKACQITVQSGKNQFIIEAPLHHRYAAGEMASNVGLLGLVTPHKLSADIDALFHFLQAFLWFYPEQVISDQVGVALDGSVRVVYVQLLQENLIIMITRFSKHSTLASINLTSFTNHLNS